MAPPLTIGYDATAAMNQRAGIGRYARELLLALSRQTVADTFRLPFAHSVDPLPAPELGPRFTWQPLPASDRVLNAFWQRLNLPVPIEWRTGRLDVFHSPDFSLAPSRSPSIVTIHDLAFEVAPQLAYPSLAAYLHTIVPRVVKRASSIIVTSQNTKVDIVERLGVSEDRIHVIPEGVSPGFTPVASTRDAAVRERLDITGRFILSVGTLEPRKNLVRLLEAFAMISRNRQELKLVIAGKLGWLYHGILERRHALGLENSVLLLHQVDDDDLQALYRLADITVYPTLYEGFGLPALEAMASGSPLACSGNSAVGELVADAAAIFDPWDVEDMAATIDTLISNVDRRQTLREMGPKRAAAFTWDRAADSTCRLYHDVAAS
jgi:glycosyltransferase involved in cell wall biosynthesis